MRLVKRVFQAFLEKMVNPVNKDQLDSKDYKVKPVLKESKARKVMMVSKDYQEIRAMLALRVKLEPLETAPKKKWTSCPELMVQKGPLVLLGLVVRLVKWDCAVCQEKKVKLDFQVPRENLVEQGTLELKVNEMENYSDD